MNYDFLTVEDYNTIVLNYADGFREDYLLNFSDLTGLSEGFYTIDGFITVTVKNSGVFLEILNACFTGSFCLLDADNSSYNILDYDADKHSLSLKLNMDDEDTTNGKLLLHLANTTYFAINENPYIIENLNPFIFTSGNVSVLDIIVKDKNGDNVNGNAVLKAFVDTSTVTYPIVDGKCRIYTNFWEENSFELVIGDYHTVFPAKWIKQTPSLDIDSESALYQGVKKAQLIVGSSNLENVPVTIEYNGKKIESVFNSGLTSFYLDLRNHFEDTLDLHFIIDDTKTMKGGEFSFTVETSRLAGSLSDLKRGYSVLEPTVYDLNTNNESEIIFDDVAINYVREDRCNSIIVVKTDNVTFNNFKFGDGRITSSLKDSIITLNNCEIRRLDNIKSKIIVNNCILYITSYIYSPISNAEFNDCSFIKIGSSNTPLLKIVNYGEVLFNNCNFILKYNINVSFGVKNSIMDISINAKVNNVPATQLKNNKFPMLNNKSEIDLELKNCNVTSDNGMIWTVSDSNTVYMENVKIEEV